MRREMKVWELRRSVLGKVLRGGDGVTLFRWKLSREFILQP
jgi:hypothetical protein